MFTVDASVWINAFVPSEPGHADSLAFVDQIERRRTLPVVVPTLVRAEVARAISRIICDPGVAIRFARTWFACRSSV